MVHDDGDPTRTGDRRDPAGPGPDARSGRSRARTAVAIGWLIVATYGRRYLADRARRSMTGPAVLGDRRRARIRPARRSSSATRPSSASRSTASSRRRPRCSAAARPTYDGAPPNSHTCPVCLGLPGALPVINRRAVEHVLATGVAIGATTPDATRWDRKNYFYPDLPKGYQISQYDLPLAADGALTFETSRGPVAVGITRAHLEEDTAKLIHAHRRRRAAGSQPGRLQPLGRAADGDRHRSGHPHGRGRRGATPRSCGCCCGRSARPTRTWRAARCASRPTSRSGRAGPRRSGRGSRSRT